MATVTATNAFGTSDPSEANTVGALVETVPHQHASAPTRGALTYETQIEVEYAALAGVETGGSPITSYVVLWDQGLAGALTPLLGDSSPNLETSVTFNTGITSGETYVFAVFGRNAHGDGA